MRHSPVHVVVYSFTHTGCAKYTPAKFFGIRSATDMYMSVYIYSENRSSFTLIRSAIISSTVFYDIYPLQTCDPPVATCRWCGKETRLTMGC